MKLIKILSDTVVGWILIVFSFFFVVTTYLKPCLSIIQIVGIGMIMFGVGIGMIMFGFGLNLIDKKRLKK
jgi:predicted phage tail protein